VESKKIFGGTRQLMVCIASATTAGREEICQSYKLVEQDNSSVVGKANARES
jgi:hypothetical protein